MGAVAAVIAIAAGCGDDESETTEPATATESSSHEPGSPAEGEPDYAGLGTWWRELPADRRLDSAADFIDDHPAECGGVGSADLERQARIAFGYDFPDAAPTDQVMLETCALLRDGD